METKSAFYFNAYHDLKDWNQNDALTNAGLVLKVVSYATIAIPIIIAAYNLCTTGNLSGIVEPVTVPLELDKKIKKAFQDNFADKSKIQTLEGLIAKLEQQIASLKLVKSPKSEKVLELIAQVANLEQELAKLAKSKIMGNTQGSSSLVLDLQEQVEKMTKERDAALKKAKSEGERADKLFALFGKSHIKRDWEQTTMDSVFPAGEDFKNEFLKVFLNFESFTCDAVNVLEDYEMVEKTSIQRAAQKMFVHKVMRPLHVNCQKFISDYLDGKKKILQDEFGMHVDVTKPYQTTSLVWHAHMQPQILSMVENLSDEKVSDIMGEEIMKLHQNMLEAAEKNIIDKGENNLRIPQLTRSLLRLIAIAEMSDPRCYLGPMPGERVAYKEDPSCMLEVFSPGVRKYGRIKVGDEVEVVKCGLYFEPSSGKPQNDEPIVPYLVRRIAQ